MIGIRRYKVQYFRKITYAKFGKPLAMGFFLCYTLNVVTIKHVFSFVAGVYREGRRQRRILESVNLQQS